MTNLKPDAVDWEAEIRRLCVAHDLRVTELLQHNNELLERARRAEAEVRSLERMLRNAFETVVHFTAKHGAA